MSTTTVDVAVCHVCKVRPVAAREDADAAGPTSRRLVALAGDENKAVAHIAAVAIAYDLDAEAWKRLAAAAETPARRDKFRKHAAVAAETAIATAQAAQDAKAVTTP